MDGFLNPTSVLGQIELRKGMIGADFGCGSGGWTIPLARNFSEGKVYAFDINEEMLSALKGRLSMEKLNNVEAQRCNLEIPKSTELRDNSIDLVLVPNLLFQIKNKKQILEEAKRILRPGSQMLVLDWNPGANMGPQESRVSEEEVKKISEELNLKLENSLQAGSYHYGLLFRK